MLGRIAEIARRCGAWTHVDGRFQSNPLVTGFPHIRFYASVPLRPTGNYAVGTLCVIGPERDRLTDRQRAVLIRLGALAEQLMRLRLMAKMESMAHDRAEQQETHYRYLAENTADMVLVHDEELVVRYMSPNVNVFLGFDPGETWGTRAGRPILDDDGREVLFKAIRLLSEERPMASSRVMIYRKDGSTREVEIHTRAIFADGKIQEYQSSARDISHLATYERDLRAANLKLQGMVDERTRLIRGIAHDLAAPLAAIRVTAESLTSQLTEQPMIDQASRLEGFAQAAEAFAGDLRRVIDPETAEYALTPRPVQVRPIVERAVAQVAHLPGGNLTMDLANVEAFIDPHAMSRITTNLVTNANRHTPPGTAIEVSLTGTKNAVTLRVADQGPGIPIEMRTLVLEPYVTTTSTGSGLGLAISKTLVEGLGGQLYISDNRPSGTVVSAIFPATSASVVG
jgi:PAS domain S-box-containing protein